MAKITVTTLAKSLGEKPGKLRDLLAIHYPETVASSDKKDVKSNTIVLGENEFNFAVAHYLNSYVFESMNDFKALCAAEIRARTASEAKTDAKKEPDKTEETKSEEAKSEEAKSEETKSEPKTEAKSEEKTEAKSDNKTDNKNKNADSSAKSAEQNGEKTEEQGESRKPRLKEDHKINTSKSVVNLTKYDEHYDDLADRRGGSRSKRDDRTSNKTRVKAKGRGVESKKGQNRENGKKGRNRENGKKGRDNRKNRFRDNRNPFGKNKKQKKETEEERKKRLEKERSERNLKITIPESITVGEFASLLRVTPVEVTKKLMFSMKIMATVNRAIDFETAELLATEFGAEVEKEVVVSLEERYTDTSEDNEEDLVTRDPVVVVMGHVDHGKTSILDAIRDTAVTSTEAGGITRAIGAYRVRVGDKKITFLDTPGHEAFTAMRARGAMATDIAVLVVAADDGIMPQTVEAISHAKMAGVQVIVAINKMDKEGANPDLIKQRLTNHELVPEEWGGDTICVPVSAKTKMGIDDLLENILLVAEVLDLRANPKRTASGVVIESRLDKSKGPIASLLVQNGTLKSDDIVVCGSSWGRIRAMTNEHGKNTKKAGPSVPVEIMGLDTVPSAGDRFTVALNEKGARLLAEERREKEKRELLNRRNNKVTMDNLSSVISEGKLKELSIIVKADVNGSVEAIAQNLEKLSNEEVRVKVIHGAVGAVNESDVMLATTSNAIIVAFNVRPDASAKTIAERNGVDIRMYRVIYDAIEEIQSAMKGMLAPKFREAELGKAEIRNVFSISKIGKIAGCYILEGKAERGALVRIVRDNIIIADDTIASLQRGKDAVKEVATNFECGIGLEKYGDIKEGDILEFYKMEEYRD